MNAPSQEQEIIDAAEKKVAISLQKHLFGPSAPIGSVFRTRVDDVPVQPRQFPRRGNRKQSSIGFQPVGNDGYVAECVLISGDSDLSGKCRSIRAKCPSVRAGSLFYIQGSGASMHT